MWGEADGCGGVADGCGVWQMGVGVWQMGVGVWQMGVGVWQMGVGCSLRLTLICGSSAVAFRMMFVRDFGSVSGLTERRGPDCITRIAS